MILCMLLLLLSSAALLFDPNNNNPITTASDAAGLRSPQRHSRKPKLLIQSFLRRISTRADFA